MCAMGTQAPSQERPVLRTVFNGTGVGELVNQLEDGSGVGTG